MTLLPPRALVFILLAVAVTAIHAGETPRNSCLVVRAGDRDNRVPTDPPGADVVVSKADPKQRAPLNPPRSEGSATYSFSPDDHFLFDRRPAGIGPIPRCAHDRFRGLES